jgi:hypothetical protein
MKKSIFIAVLGLAAGIASSYGQGYVYMNSYSANQGSAFITTIFGGSTTPDGTYTAELYYALGTISDPVNENSIASITSPISGAFTAIPSSLVSYDANGDGYFGASPIGPTVTVPGYSSGAISFEIFATNVGGTIVGRSGAWTESMIGTSTQSVSFFGDNGTAPNFLVATVVPEPTTLALAGLGGLASLVAFRRKQS